MNSTNLNGTVSYKEVEALKDMIFKRVKERAEALTSDVKSSYVENTYNDVMDLARMSFASNRNPFVIEQNVEKEDVSVSQCESKEDCVNEKINEAREHVKILKQEIYSNQQSFNQDKREDVVKFNMLNARKVLEQRHQFVGALEFLNKQAAIELNIGRSTKLDIVI